MGSWIQWKIVWGEGLDDSSQYERVPSKAIGVPAEFLGVSACLLGGNFEEFPVVADFVRDGEGIDAAVGGRVDDHLGGDESFAFQFWEFRAVEALCDFDARLHRGIITLAERVLVRNGFEHAALPDAEEDFVGVVASEADMLIINPIIIRSCPQVLSNPRSWNFPLGIVIGFENAVDRHSIISVASDFVQVELFVFDFPDDNVRTV